MKVVIIIGLLIIALLIIVPLLERYQHQLGLHKATKLSKYIWPLVGVMLVVQLLYIMFA